MLQAVSSDQLFNNDGTSLKNLNAKFHLRRCNNIYMYLRGGGGRSVGGGGRPIALR